MSSQPERPAGELLTYLQMLAGGARPTQVFDLRYAVPDDDVVRRRFVSVLQIEQLAKRIHKLASDFDVYVGATLRDRARGGKAAITGSRLLYIESDDPRVDEHVAAFPYRPAMVIASGSPGHLHLYWQLCARARSAEVESANRRLALALHGERGCTDIARMLRPPDSFNHKHTPPAPVILVSHDAGARHALADLLAGLPDDPTPHLASPGRSAGSHVGRTALDRALLAIPAADYVRVLAGREPNRAGKVLCPFHDERDPSLQLFPDNTFFCFGARCRKGGTIFDFAALLWNTGTREADFLRLRQRLARTFALTAAANEASP